MINWVIALRGEKKNVRSKIDQMKNLSKTVTPLDF